MTSRMYDYQDKPSVLTALERAEFVALWEATATRRLSKEERTRYGALRARMSEGQARHVRRMTE